MGFDQSEEHLTFRAGVSRFLDRHAPPEALSKWREAGVVPRNFWTLTAQAGLLGLSVSADYGGPGGDFSHEAILIDELYGRGLDAFGVTVHNGIVAPYIQDYGDEGQRRRWLPGMVSGKFVSAIAMTEPGTGSDLKSVRTTARRVSDGYRINGQKTFISNGQTANLIIVVCRTSAVPGSGAISLFVVETDRAEGFRRGRNLEKLGLEAADTSELFFDDVLVPDSALLGREEGRGFYQLMEKLPQERLMIAVMGAATIRRALSTTIEYVKQRKAFGKAVFDFQNTQFKLAECATAARIAEVFVNDCIQKHLRGELDSVTASMAKYWVSDVQNRIVDECLQLHGGYGYMLEYEIARMFRDSRVQKIYGGTNEIMKMLIARSL